MMSRLDTSADLVLIERVEELVDRSGRTALSRFRVARADWVAAWRELVDHAVGELVEEGFDAEELQDAADCLPVPKG